MHRLLRQQIRKRLDIDPETLEEILDNDDLFAEELERIPGMSLVDFLYTLSESFEQADRYQNRTHHALQMSTKEINRHTEELRIERETFRGILESAPYGVLVLDKAIDGVCHYLNPEFAALTGYSIEDIRKVSDLFENIYPDPEYRRQRMDFWSNKMNESFYHFEATIQVTCRNGSVKELKYQANPFKDDQVILMLSDVTKERQQEKAMLDRENQLKTQLDYLLSTDSEDIEISFADLIDLEVIQNIQDVFAETNDVASIITDIEGNPITQPSNFCNVCEVVRGTEEGLKRCIASDKLLGEKAQKEMKPVCEQCGSTGFLDASAPIIVDGKHLANWLIGQSNTGGVTPEHIEYYANEIGADVDKMKDAYAKMPPSMSRERFENVLKLLWLFADQLSKLSYKNLQLAREHTAPHRQEEDLEKVR